MRSTQYEAVIIGAGVQGTSAAYHLAERGIKRILILEELGAAGKGSSGRSGSMLMKSRENEVKIELSKYSYDWLMSFTQRFDEELSFNRIGFLSLVPPELAPRYEREHQLRLDLGVPSVLLNPAEIQRLAPAVQVDGIVFGVLGPDDGVIDPDQLIRNYLAGARRSGAAVAFDTAATSIEVRDGRVRSVTAGDEEYECEIVVNAAGPQATKVSAWVGIELPIANLRRSLFFVDCPSSDVQIGPMVEEAGVEWYYRGIGDGRALIGMGLESEGDVSDEPDMTFWRQVQQAAARRVPSFAQARVVSGTSGFRPLVPDILPIVGPVDGVDGYYNLCGWGGEGIMHSPAGGQMLADSVFGTESPQIPWQRCAFSRFADAHGK